MQNLGLKAELKVEGIYLGRGRGPVKGTRERNERADQSTYIHV
jgi:hypothetical protein